jgi:Ran GTPase-activating protein (RanGAP) involved in mRNA processing and transport
MTLHAVTETSNAWQGIDRFLDLIHYFAPPPEKLLLPPSPEEIMATVIEQIRENSPDLAELLLAEEVEAYCGSATVEDLLEAFRVNTVIEYVRLDRDFLPSLPDDACPGLFQAVGKLPALKEAHIKHAAIHVRVLSDFIVSATGLEHLTLGCLALDGTSDDFDLVTQSLKGHPNLQTFCMSDFSLHNNDIVLDDFIETLSTIPNLQTVKLEVSHSRRSSIVGSEAAAREVCVSISGKALANLTRTAPKLRELVLNRLNLSHADFEALAEAIGVAPQLQVLGMPRCHIDDQAVFALAYAIGQSKTLQKIDMSCNKITDEGW